MHFRYVYQSPCAVVCSVADGQRIDFHCCVTPRLRDFSERLRGKVGRIYLRAITHRPRAPAKVIIAPKAH